MSLDKLCNINYTLNRLCSMMLCLQYYMMSGLFPVDVRQALQHKLHSKQVMYHDVMSTEAAHFSCQH